MKQLYIFMLFMCGFGSFGFAQEAALSGKVTDNEGQTLVAVTITVDGKKTVTDTGGHYTIHLQETRRVKIVAEYAGFNVYEHTLQIRQGNNSHNIVLKRKEQQLEGVVVTAQKQGNRNEETLIKVENSIMPVTIIDRRTIELMGSRRLDEVVKEQTGIAIVNDITGGSRSVGVQMQGFSSEYVLVLIDGQPMVGRNGGNFDLSRISVSNVERIEITKGAASLLYGGDALGGTINVITRHNITRPQAYVAAAYGTNTTVDITADGETPVFSSKGSLNLNGNYYHTAGFNTSQGAIKGTTAPPYDNYGAQGRFKYQFNDNNRVSVSARYGLRKSFMFKDFGVKYSTEDVLNEQDINLSANYEHRFSDRWRTMTRYYLTRYSADMSVVLSQGDSLSQSDFGQLLHRLEQQVSYTIVNRLDVITGVGGTVESIDENILTDENKINAVFAYTQANWKLLKNLELTGGLRFDHIWKYGWRLDPSVAVKYQLLPTLTFKAAYGTAFKAPDMRKQYQTFYNPNSNYLIVGSAVMRNTINQLREAGQVSQYELEPVYDEIKGLALNAEMNKSYNVSVIWESLDKKYRIEPSVFYHDITNQINPILIGKDIDGMLIYSYRNNAKAYYKGAEISASALLLAGFKLSGGYQYLIAKDRSVESEIKEGGKFFDPLFDPATGFVNYAPTKDDYWGLENRSRHMFNVQAFYTYSPLNISGNVRVNFRGKYPFSDKNGNGYTDRFDTFVRDHYLLNAGVEKKLLDRRLSIRFNVENILNFVDQKVPSQPGRLYFAGIAYNIL